MESAMSSLSLLSDVSLTVEASVVLLVTLAMLSDLHTRRIPNQLVASALVVALLEQCLQRGLIDGSLAWLGGLVVGMLLLFPGYLLRMMGAGDVKLLGAVGAFFCAQDALLIGLVSCVVGGLYGVVMMVRTGQIRRCWNNIRWVILAAVQPKEASLELRDSTPVTIGRIPYAVAIALGTSGLLWLGR
jgi:prepilin peptidase CpaA